MKKLFLFFLIPIVAGCSLSGSSSTSVPTSILATEESGFEATAESTVEAEAEPVETVTGAALVEETATASSSAAESDLDHADMLNHILFTRQDGPKILNEIRESGDDRFVAGLIDVLRYQRNFPDDTAYTLNYLTNQNLDDSWHRWVEWAGNHPEIKTFAGYTAWKGDLFAQVDPNFLRFVNENTQVDPNSRVEEIVWGGVRVDGIPALDNPTMIDPDQAAYLLPDERVFGVSINGDTRAYPARFLDWHEMFNDIVGGEPVSLAY